MSKKFWGEINIKQIWANDMVFEVIYLEIFA